MGLTDEFVSGHFNHFDLSFKEHAKLRDIIASIPNSPRNFFYVCPLCLKNHLLALNTTLHQSSEFTKDHFPPQNAGGVRTLLICQECNNNAGSDYDYILQDLLQFRAFSKRIPYATLPIKHTVSTIPGRYKGQFKITDLGDIEIQVKKDPKTKIAPLDKWIETSKFNLDYKIVATIQEPLPEIVCRALLKTAYLYCFVCWGYEFVFSENGKKIREVLSGQSSYPITGGSLFFLDEESNLPEGVSFLQMPKEWQSLIVNVPLRLKDINYKTMAIIPIPPPTEDGWDALHSLNKLINDMPAVTNISVVAIDNSLQAGKLYGYSQSWLDHFVI